jgi:hypothetical protein
MLWGYIAPRYLGDFVPFLVLASAVAMADISRRLEWRRRSARVGAVGVIAVVALFSIGANIGMAIVPTEEWDTTQVLSYVQAQKTVSDLTGHPLEASVVRGNTLPPWGPAGQLYVIGNCNGLYISNGENFSTVPTEQYHRTTWMTVELGRAFQHAFRLTVKSPKSGGMESVPLVSAGQYTVKVNATSSMDGHGVQLSFGLYRTGRAVQLTKPFEVNSGATHSVAVTTDPVKHQIGLALDGVVHILTSFQSDGSIHVDSVNAPRRPPTALLVKTMSTQPPTLCQSLIH